MESKKLKNSLPGLVLVYLAVGFLLLNLLANSWLQRFNFDFTENKLYTLSANSKKISAAVNKPIMLKLYFSKKIAKTYPYLLDYAARVEELLFEYQKFSNGKIRVETIELGPFSGAELQLVNDQLLGIPVEGTNEELYFGLAAISEKTKEYIPFVEPNKEAELERTLSAMIYKVATLDASKYAAELKSIAKREDYARPLTKFKELQSYTQTKYQVRTDALTQKLAKLKEDLAAVKTERANTDDQTAQQLAKDEELIKLEMIVTKAEVKAVKEELNREVADLEKNIQLLTIGIVPGFALMLGFMLWWQRKKSCGEPVAL